MIGKYELNFHAIILEKSTINCFLSLGCTGEVTYKLDCEKKARTDASREKRTYGEVK